MVALLVLLIGGVELWARSMDLQVPDWFGPGAQQGGLQTGHPTRLWGMEQGERANGDDITTWINSHGLRGEEPELPRPSGRQRILTLGDSSFFGFLVSDEDVFTNQLQRILRQRGIDVDVINAGVAGYSIAQHQLFMDEQGWDLDPTLIVYCNLWSDNTWDTFRDEDLLATRRFAEFNPLVHSAAMRLLAQALSKPQTEQGGRIIMWRGEMGWPEGKTRRVPLRRYISIHDGLIREAASRGIGGAFVIPTNSFMISGDIDTSTAPSWDPYFQAFESLGAHHSQPVVDLNKVFLEAVSEELASTDLLLDLMHPSAAGHLRMAQALADALLSAGWPENNLAGQTEAFDATSIEDHPAPVWTDDDGAGSSQRYLYDISEEEKEAIRARAAAMAAAGPPAPESPDGAPSPGPASVEHTVVHTQVPNATPPPGGSWPVFISVEGSTPPFKLVVRDPDGSPVGSARLNRPTSIRLMMRTDLDALTAEVTDGSGQMITQALSRKDPKILLDLGD